MLRQFRVNRGVIWFVPALLSLAGLLVSLSTRDYELAQRSSVVMISSFGLANVDSLLRWA